MGRPSALPKDGDSAAPSSAKSHVKTNAGKPSAKARDKMGGGKGGGGGKGSGGGKGGGGGASPSSAPLAPPATLFPALPLSILRVSLATPSPLAAPAASTCGATALAAIAAALVDSSASLAADGDVRRTLGAAVAEWVKALGGGGADGGGGGGVVDNVGRYVAAEIAALPAADGGADTLAGVGGGAANATALGALLGGRVKEFGERRIEAACQAVGAATAEAVLRSGDEVVVWGVGAQPEVVAALERSIVDKQPFRLTVVTPTDDASSVQSFLSLPFPTHTPTLTPYASAASAFGFSSSRGVLLLPARFVSSNGAVVTTRGGGGLAVAAKRQGAVVAVLTVSLAFGADGRLRERGPWPRSPAATETTASEAAGREPATVAEDVIDPHWIDYVVTEDGAIAPSMAPRVDKAFNSFA